MEFLFNLLRSFYFTLHKKNGKELTDSPTQFTSSFAISISQFLLRFATEFDEWSVIVVLPEW